MEVRNAIIALRMLNADRKYSDKIRNPSELIKFIKDSHPNDYEECFGWLIDELEEIRDYTEQINSFL